MLPSAQPADELIKFCKGHYQCANIEPRTSIRGKVVRRTLSPSLPYGLGFVEKTEKVMVYVFCLLTHV